MSSLRNKANKLKIVGAIFDLFAYFSELSTFVTTFINESGLDKNY